MKNNLLLILFAFGACTDPVAKPLPATIDAGTDVRDVGADAGARDMPILVAIAFRETELLWGIVLFVMITTAGLSLRFYRRTH